MAAERRVRGVNLRATAETGHLRKSLRKRRGPERGTWQTTLGSTQGEKGDWPRKDFGQLRKVKRKKKEGLWQKVAGYLRSRECLLKT